ncbi:MAG: DUF202 domain-containing protein [Planctomycetota bacterium]
MCKTPYSAVEGRELTLCDRLAIDRTGLANERTLLAYGRTGLALMIVGGSLIRFFDSLTSTLTGWLFVAAGALTIAIGFSRFLSVRRRLNALTRRTAMATDDEGGSLHREPSAPL